jgi:outer membrane receptor protein involved in Fe transport
MATSALGAIMFCNSAMADQTAATSAVETVTVTAQKLTDARNGIQTQLGASTYKITADEIEAQPGGDNNLLNQVILQAPGVAQDSFGQLHIRGEHNGLQYRLNGIIIPEGISVFGQTLDPRLAGSVSLITGALPAEYGLRTAGIIDVQTKSGEFAPGGEVSIYGGSHGEIEPSFDYGGSSGNLNYFVSGDYQANTLGIESPDGSNDPLHDRTKQVHGFAFLQDILDQSSSVTAIFGTSNDMFQIPDLRGLQPDLGLSVNGQTAFASNNLNENQREITHFGILSYLHSQGAFDFQISGFGRYSSLYFTPDAIGDLLYDGIAQTAYKRDEAYGLQAEGAWHLGDHTIRGGVVAQADDLASRTSSDVLPVVDGVAGDAPLTIPDNSTNHVWSYSVYLQDEWKIFPALTVNYGLRYDQFHAFDSEDQVSPRLNVVWQPLDDTTIHAGFSRYFSPPPIELVASTDVALFNNTTAAAPTTADTTPKAERADYYDIGISQRLLETLTIGLDTYDKQSRNLLDEGQFGAPIILTPFNYLTGRQYGVEFTGAYDIENFSAYLNAALERAAGKDIITSQFDFDPGDLTYIANNYIPLDHQQIASVSAGASYLWKQIRFSADMIYGSGLRKDGETPNGDHVPGYTQINIGISRAFDLGSAGGLTARFDVINLFDDKYEIRDGTGIGVGAPQYGPRRGFFFGLSKSI